MSSKKIISVLLLVLMFTCLFQVSVFSAPSVVGNNDTVSETGVGEAFLFSENLVEIDIGEKQAESNVRFAEINGVQSAITENNNKFFVETGDDNLLVEITEKVDADASSVVKTQYFYVDVSNKACTRIDMDNYMQSYDEKDIRTVGEKGIRFKAHILNSAKMEERQYVVEEYGFIIATEQALKGEELTLNASKYVRGIGYNRANGLDIVFDGTNDDYDVFTLVIKNIPVSNYKTKVVCKTYTRLIVHGKPYVVYGEPMTGSIYEIAADIFSADNTNLDVAAMIKEYVTYSGANTSSFTNASLSSEHSDSEVTVNGSFTNTDAAGETYNVYVFTYDKFGDMVSVKKSQDFSVVSGENSFSANFALANGEQQTEAIVLTSDMDPICKETVINWRPTDRAFYTKLASSSYKSDTDFSEFFNPDLNVSYIEGLTLVSNLHGIIL